MRPILPSLGLRGAALGRLGVAVALSLLLADLAGGTATRADMLVPAGTIWKYLDDGSDQGTAWRAIAFDDGPWASGPAQLGYGDGDEATVVDYGPDPLNKYVTTYFRRTFDVPDPSAYKSVTLRMLRDDGAVVYLNGAEVFRTNMDPGPVAFDTLAAGTVGGSDEDAVHSLYLSVPGLVAGVNVVAVEVHQAAVDSSDISFDLMLEASELAMPLEFAWAGAITPTSARVNARSKIDSTAVRLHVSENSDLSGPRVSGFHTAEQAINNRVVSIGMPGLTRGTTYHYAVEVDGALDLSKQGQFTTPVASPLSFTFGFASCAFTGSTHPVFDTIRGWNPFFFFHLGDFHYESIGSNDRDRFRGAYDSVLASPAQSALYRSTPIAYAWDDHDYGPNNGDSTAPGREAARLTYQEYVPHYPLVAGNGDVPIYQAFSIGRVRFILTDLRSERTPYLDPDSPSKTMFGAVQKNWFKQELLAANGVYPVIVWAQTMPWIGTTGDDGWYVYTYERQEIADFIKDNDVRGLFMISGDAHMLAIDDGSNSDYATGGGAAFPVMHAAAMHQNGSLKGGPYSEGAYPGSGQFGLMTISDDGVSPICISWSGRDWNNNEIVGWGTCLPSPLSSDTDSDGTDDVADCAFADPTAWGPPADVADLVLRRNGNLHVVLAWSSQNPATGLSTSYDIVRGLLSELRADTDFRRAGCLVGGHPDTPYFDGSGPPTPGECEYFLVRAVNPCGSGGYGHADPFDPRFPLDGDAPCPLP